MPKKPNGSGGMQEYIPAGNGDASGEYGNSKGENKHFSSFKKGSSAKGTSTKTDKSQKGKTKKTQSVQRDSKGRVQSIKNGKESIIYPENRDKFLKDYNLDDDFYFDGGDLIEYETERDTGISVHDNGSQADYLLQRIKEYQNSNKKDDWGNWATKTDKKVPKNWEPDGFDGDTRFYHVNGQKGIQDASVNPNGSTTIYTNNGYLQFDSLKEAQDFLNIKDKKQATDKLWERGWVGINDDYALDDIYGNEEENKNENKPQEKPETQKPSKAKATSSNKVTYNGKDYDVDSTAYNGAIINAFGTSITDEKKQGLGGNGYTVFDGGDEIYFNTFDEAYNYAKKNERKKASNLFGVDL